MIDFRMLEIQEIEGKWEKAKEILKPSFRYIRNSHNVDDYRSRLGDGTLQLWFATRDENPIGACVTSIENEQSGRVCFVHSVAGEDLKDWFHMLDKALDHFALSHGCHAIETVTRKGFSKFFPEYVEDGIIYVKMLGAKNG